MRFIVKNTNSIRKQFSAIEINKGILSTDAKFELLKRTIGFKSGCYHPQGDLSRAKKWRYNCHFMQAWTFGSSLRFFAHVTIWYVCYVLSMLRKGIIAKNHALVSIRTVTLTRMKVYRLLLLVFAHCWVYSSFAQTTAGEIEELEITIDKSRTITLPEILPDPSRAALPIKPVTVPKQRYNYLDYNVKMPDVEPKIKVLTMKQDPVFNAPLLHLRAGLGVPLSSYAELLFKSKTKNNFNWGIHGKHYGLYQGPQRKVASGFTENFVRAYTTYFTDAVVVDGTFEYARNSYNYYGIPKDQERKADSVAQFYQYLKAQLLIKQNAKTSAIGWDGGLLFSNMNDAYKAREYNLDLFANVNYDIDSVSGIKTHTAFFNSRRSDSSDIARTAFWFKPFYYHRLGEFYIEVGFNLAADNDTIKSSNRLNLFPHLKVDLTLIPQKLSIYGGFNGDLEKRSLQHFIGLNPWVGPNVRLAHTVKQFDVFTGADFNATQNLSLAAKVSYLQYRNMPVFVNNWQDSSRFDVAYDQGNVRVVRLNASMTYNITKDLSSQLSLEYNSYTTDSLKKAWHLPALLVNANLSYRINEQWSASTRINYQGDMVGRLVATGTEVSIPGMLNWGLRANYQINKKFTAFADLDNILNQQNQRYLYYPTRGILFMIGGSYTLWQ